jgi:hypothetical protein
MYDTTSGQEHSFLQMLTVRTRSFAKKPYIKKEQTNNISAISRTRTGSLIKQIHRNDGEDVSHSPHVIHYSLLSG